MDYRATVSETPRIRLRWSAVFEQQVPARSQVSPAELRCGIPAMFRVTKKQILWSRMGHYFGIRITTPFSTAIKCITKQVPMV